MVRYYETCVHDGGGDGDSPDENYWNVSTVKGKAFPVFFTLYYYLLIIYDLLSLHS